MSNNPGAISHGATGLSLTGFPDGLPERMLACLIAGIVARLDLNELQGSKPAATGHRAEPEILLALLFYAYSSGMFASRELEQATRHSETYRFIAANTRPNRHRIAAFRRCFRRELENYFVQILTVLHTMQRAGHEDDEPVEPDTGRQFRIEANALLNRADAADAEAHEQRGGEKQQRPSGPAIAGRRSGENDNTSSTGQTKKNRGRVTHGTSRTYTFLSKKQAVMALASDVSRSVLSPLQLAKRAVLSKGKKAATPGPVKKRPRHRSAPFTTTAALAIPALAAILVLTWHFDVDEPNSSVQVTPFSGSIKRADGKYPVLQNKPVALASLEPTDIVLSPEPDSDPGPSLSDNTDTMPAVADIERQVEAGPAQPTTTQVEPASVTAEETPEYAIATHALPEVVTVEEKPALPVTTQAEPATATALANPVDSGTQTIVAAPGQDIAHREQWILEQSSRNYMLQLMWSWKQFPVQKFIEQHDLSGPVAYYKERRNNRSRYVLLYGGYPNRKSAIGAVGSLPETIRINRPWARKLSSIQGIIREQGNTPGE